MDEATEWRDKYDKSAKRLNKDEVELAELRRVTETLKQKAADDAAEGDACTSERTRLEAEARQHLIDVAAEKKAREDNARRVRELEEDLTSARIQRDRERREEEALRADLAQAQEMNEMLQEELARHKRWKQQVELKLKRLGGAGLEIAKHAKGDYKKHGGKGHAHKGEDEDEDEEDDGKESGEDDGDDAGKSDKKRLRKGDKDAGAEEGNQDGEDGDRPAPKLRSKKIEVRR